MEINENDLFIKMYDDGEFSWDNFEEGTYQFLQEQSIKKNQYVGDGYIDTVNIIKVNERFCSVGYTLKGKDLDEEYDMENPIEVFPHEVIAIEYKTYKEEKLNDTEGKV